MGTQSLVGLTMVYMLPITSLLAVLLEMTQAAPAPAPFLLDLLAPRITIRRQGKQIDDGYGVPKDSYGVPEEQVAESSSYDAPKPSYSTTTSTLPPCSYEAPTTTTTAAPSYSAPTAQNTGGFPDILGFIGNIIKPKLRTENQLESGILGNGCLCLSPPVDSAYGPPQETSYEAPQSNAYEVPKSTAYEAPKSETYEAPQADTYEAPQAGTYEAPQAETYEAPQSETYEAPEEVSNDYEVDIAVNERNKDVAQ